MASGKISRFVQALKDGTPTRFTGEVLGRPVQYTVYNTANGYDDPKNMSAAAMWKSQPHLRTVVDFQARQISLLGLHLFNRQNEDTVVRVRDGEVAAAIARPNPLQTTSEFVENVVSEWALYNDVYILVLPNKFGTKDLWVIPASWVEAKWKSSFVVEGYTISGFGDKPLEVGPEQVIRFKGWTAGDPQKGTSPVDTLRLILAEQHSARVYRDQQWRSKGRQGGYIKRPIEAPDWDNTARGRFMTMWRAFTTNTGERAGEDVLLEDGMTYESAKLIAREEQFVEATKLSLETVCQVYHINPTMVGMLDNANYSNVREFRRGLYGDTLGPIIKKIEDRFNTFLLPMLGAAPGLFVEFNVEAMLKGSFEEQAAVVSKATGRPWQSLNEARKLFNLPPVEGGDEIVMPLNLTTMNRAVEDDMPADEKLTRGNYAATLIRSGFDPNESMASAGLEEVTHLGLLPVTVQRPAAPADGEEVDQALVDEITKTPDEVLLKFLERQHTSVTAKRKAGKEDWWDGERWERELTADLAACQGYTEAGAKFVAACINAKARELYAADRDDSLGALKELAGKVQAS